MLFEFEVGWDHGCVKFVHPNLFVVLAREKVTSVRKLDFAANLNWHGVVRLELILQNVHQFERTVKANCQLETARVERQRVSLFVENLANFGLESITSRVRPQPDSSIS